MPSWLLGVVFSGNLYFLQKCHSLLILSENVTSHKKMEPCVWDHRYYNKGEEELSWNYHAFIQIPFNCSHFITSWWSHGQDFILFWKKKWKFPLSSFLTQKMAVVFLSWGCEAGLTLSLLSSCRIFCTYTDVQNILHMYRN